MLIRCAHLARPVSATNEQGSLLAPQWRGHICTLIVLPASFLLKTACITSIIAEYHTARPGAVFFSNTLELLFLGHLFMLLIRPIPCIICTVYSLYSLQSLLYLVFICTIAVPDEFFGYVKYFLHPFIY